MARVISVCLLLLTFVASSPSAQEPPQSPAPAKHHRSAKAAPNAKASQKKKKPEDKPLTGEARRAFIRRAQVWMPTNVPEMNLRLGPQGPGACQPHEMVT